MGILTLLRNAFGRSRKARATEPEGATETPAHSPSVPEPRHTPTEEPEPVAAAEEHELVAAAFDKVKTAPAEPANPVTAEEETPEAPTPAQTETKPDQQPPAEAEEKTPPTTPTKPEPKPEETTEEPEPKAESATEEPEPKAEETTEEPEPKAESATEEPEPESAVEEPEPKAESTAEEPEPEPESATEEPEPKAESTAEEPDPEPESATEETEPESAVGTEKTEPEAEAEPATAPEAEAEPATEPEAEVTAPVKADAEAEADEAAVTAEATTAPQAADGEEAPQGPPAADDESRTGGAGGNPDAEGEAEADPQPSPAPAPAPEEPAETEPKPQPATPLTRVRNRAPSLTTAYKAATTTLKKTDLTGTRAKVYLVLDRSASMRPYYKDGSAQALADQTLALAAHLDPEAAVHVVFFSTEVDGTTDLTLAPDHETKIDDVHAGLGRMGRTSYHAAVQAVVAHYEEHAAPGTPALVVFQTDGAPDAKTPATQSLTEAATRHPALFFSFVAFGDHDNKAFDYLRKLKTGNTSFFHAGPTPRELTDTELYEGVLATWRP
ncbi:VWA domain-containing protein [Streptomyces olivaceoviridis]